MVSKLRDGQNGESIKIANVHNRNIIIILEAGNVKNLHMEKEKLKYEEKHNGRENFCTGDHHI